MKLRKLLALAMAAVLAVSSASVAMAAETSVAEGGDLAAAISSASDGDTITLTGNVTLSTEVTISDGRKIEIIGNGHTITDATATEGSLFTVTNGQLTFRRVTIDCPEGVSNHAVQSYSSNGRVLLDTVIINGADYTSVEVNGGYAKLYKSQFNPNAGAYAEVEYGVGKNVTSLPKIDLQDQQVELYVDASTIKNIQANVSGYQNMTADEIATAIQKTVDGATWDVTATVVPDDNTGSNRSDNDDDSDYFGNETWDEVKREIAEAEEGDTIKVSATGLPYFPSSVARALKGLDITLEIRKNGVTYEVNGLEIGDIDKIWYEFDELETELLTADADSEASSEADEEAKPIPDTGR